METFEKNFALMRARGTPATVLDALRGAPQLETVPTARPECPTAFARAGGRRVALHSTRDPVREAENWVHSYPAVDTNSVAVLAGFALGYAAEAILRHPNIETLLIIEPNISHFATALRIRDLSLLIADARVQWAVGTFEQIGPAIAESLERLTSAKDDDEVAVLVHPASVQTMPESEGALRDVLTYMRDMRRMSRGVLKEKSAANAAANAEALRVSPPVSRLFGRFAGVPAMVIAPGPSLDKAMPLLPVASRRMLTVALDSALTPLLRRGVAPDFVVTVDPQPVVNKYFPAELPARTRLVFSPGSPPGIVLRFSNYRRFAAANTVDATQDPDALLMSGTVLSAAVDFCIRTGCAPVMLVGTDLAVKPDRTHASGSLGATYAPSMRECDGYFGMNVATTDSFYMYLRNMESLLKTHYASHAVWDTSEGGARIEGTERIALRDALLRIVECRMPDVDAICAKAMHG